MCPVFCIHARHNLGSQFKGHQIQEIHKSGFKIVLISNQALIKSALTGKAATNAKAKFDSVLEAAGVPATVLIATQKDSNRKPETGMWDFFTSNCNGGVEVDMGESYYVGDAAGRKYDFSDSDKMFAENVGLPFKVPEDVFGKGMLGTLPPHTVCAPRLYNAAIIMLRFQLLFAQVHRDCHSPTTP